MKITKYIHSFIMVEEGKNRVLVDPGPFSFIEESVRADQFEGIKAIFITHKHADHYDPVAIKRIAKNNPGMKVFCNSETTEVLEEVKIGAEVFEEGGREIGGFRVTAFFAEHESLPDAVPSNTAFLFNHTFLHPGDSFDPVIFNYPAKVIALPVFGPWMMVAKALEFVLKYSPEQIVPVHDGFVKDYFLERQYQNWERWLKGKGIKFNPCLDAGDSCKV